jgi:hypothetical protein
MADSADPTGHALELARSAIPATARRRTTLAAVARPAIEVAGLLLVEILGSPRARAGARPGTIAGALAGQSAPPCLGRRRGDHSADHGGAGR